MPAQLLKIASRNLVLQIYSFLPVVFVVFVSISSQSYLLISYHVQCTLSDCKKIMNNGIILWLYTVYELYNYNYVIFHCITGIIFITYTYNGIRVALYCILCFILFFHYMLCFMCQKKINQIGKIYITFYI